MSSVASPIVFPLSRTSSGGHSVDISGAFSGEAIAFKRSSRQKFASRALLKRSGFEEIGIHRRHGQLDGRWRDCVIIELLLGAGEKQQ
jgi:hypothetical protein